MQGSAALWLQSEVNAHAGHPVADSKRLSRLRKVNLQHHVGLVPGSVAAMQKDEARFGAGMLAVMVAGGVALIVAWGLRYGLLEAGRLPADCSVLRGAACTFKEALVWIFLGNKLGWLALASGAMAFFSGNRALAWVGWITSMLGIILYCFDTSAVGLLAALLALIRLPKASAQGQHQAA
ncbi:MAG: hypothetical protein JNJ44_00020 [Zoogloeaceae bacterium]|nr:hypothetical protein [Zoogloeaceae bacterium]